jgi:excisionase family DNA binding protein
MNVRSTSNLDKESVLPQSDRLLDAREAAQLLGVKVSTLYDWSYERKIPVVKLFGRSLRFRLSTLLKLMADSERPALRAQKPDAE